MIEAICFIKYYRAKVLVISYLKPKAQSLCPQSKGGQRKAMKTGTGIGPLTTPWT